MTDRKAVPGGPGTPIITGPLPISEKVFTRRVEDLAKVTGWLCYHTWNSQHSEAGWPDLALCRPPRLLLIELKAEGAKLTLAQLYWMEQLLACPGVEVFVWRPQDWETIKSTLEGKGVA